MIVDSSALLAFFDHTDRWYPAVDEVFTGGTEALIVSPYVIAEVDYMMSQRHGVHGELAALRELTSGAWDLVDFGRSDLNQAVAIVDRYSDQNVGVADASLVVLAKRYDTRTIATLDRRHFEVLRPLQGGRFEIVP